MKTHLAVPISVASMVLRLYSQEPLPGSDEPSPEATAMNSSLSGAAGVARTNTFTAADAAAYGSLNKNLLESNAQFQLLTGLARDHRKRAANFASDQPDKSKWENELADELSTQASDLLRQVNELSRRRLAFERTYSFATGALAGVVLTSGTNSLNPDEIAYVAGIQERLERTTQDLAALSDQANLYAQEVHTNNTPEEVARISSLLNLNSREVRTVQKEQSDLELKLLEFRAFRRR